MAYIECYFAKLMAIFNIFLHQITKKSLLFWHLATLTFKNRKSTPTVASSKQNKRTKAEGGGREKVDKAQRTKSSVNCESAGWQSAPRLLWHIIGLSLYLKPFWIQYCSKFMSTFLKKIHISPSQSRYWVYLSFGICRGSRSLSTGSGLGDLLIYVFNRKLYN